MAIGSLLLIAGISTALYFAFNGTKENTAASNTINASTTKKSTNNTLSQEDNKELALNTPDSSYAMLENVAPLSNNQSPILLLLPKDSIVDSTTPTTFYANIDSSRTQYIAKDTTMSKEKIPLISVDTIIKKESQSESLDCEKLYSTLTINTLKTCLGEEKGQVTFRSDETPIYLINEEPISDFNYAYYNLANGDYSYTVQIKEECPAKSFNITVGEKLCMEKNLKYSTFDV